MKINSFFVANCDSFPAQLLVCGIPASIGYCIMAFSASVTTSWYSSMLWIMLLFLPVPCLIYFFVPESYRILIANNRIDEARIVLRKFVKSPHRMNDALLISHKPVHDITMSVNNVIESTSPKLFSRNLFQNFSSKNDTSFTLERLLSILSS